MAFSQRLSSDVLVVGMFFQRKVLISPAGLISEKKACLCLIAKKFCIVKRLDPPIVFNIETLFDAEQNKEKREFAGDISTSIGNISYYFPINSSQARETVPSDS